MWSHLINKLCTYQKISNINYLVQKQKVPWIGASVRSGRRYGAHLAAHYRRPTGFTIFFFPLIFIFVPECRDARRSTVASRTLVIIVSSTFTR